MFSILPKKIIGAQNSSSMRGCHLLKLEEKTVVTVSILNKSPLKTYHIRISTVGLKTIMHLDLIFVLNGSVHSP